MNLRVKELETTENELRSKLKMKSTEIKKLEDEMKSMMDKYFQLKPKRNLIIDEPISQKSEDEVT